MLIQTSEISNWRDLQKKVATLFLEMGYRTESPYIIELAGRGKKEVDVYVEDERASVNQIMLIECKSWSNRVPQDTVHSMHTVMHGAGANTGFIISKRGFQKGAREAAKSTNIHLLTWDELQHKFGRQWLAYQSEQLEKLIAELRGIDHIHLAQNEPIRTIHNNMVFRATGKSGELMDVLADIRMVLLASIAQPQRYDVSGPIEVSVHGDTPGAVVDSYRGYSLSLPSVRAYFEWIVPTARTCLERYRTLEQRSYAAFDSLQDDVSDAAFQRVLDEATEEMPIRVFRKSLGEEAYLALIKQYREKRT